MYKIVCSLFLCILIGCVSHGADVKFNKLTHDFFYMTTTDEQERQFSKYNLEEQYDLYIFGNQVVHPPASYLACQFAKQGPVIVPFLKNKLKAAHEEATIRDIVLVFLWLSRLKLYDIPKDQELMGLLNQRVSNMHGIWKETTLEMLTKIRTSSTESK